MALTVINVQLRELLDMKQQQANIIEAKAAIKRADETVMQGRSIVVFTVITIIFVCGTCVRPLARTCTNECIASPVVHDECVWHEC
jgi:hypothetical protein